MIYKDVPHLILFLADSIMKNTGKYMFTLGLLAIVLNFANMVPRLLMWIYAWGEGPAWAIKIGLVVLGAVLYAMSIDEKELYADEDDYN